MSFPTEPKTKPTKDKLEQAAAEEEPLPPFAEQLSQQLGGWRGLVESGIPVTVFIVANIVLGWVLPPADDRLALQIAIGAAVGIAVIIAMLRLARKESVRFAVNGLFGVALGAWLAWDTGEERAFYLPGIIITLAYVVGLFVSIAVGHPLVGWAWAVIAKGGKGDWRSDTRLRRVTGWLTALWAVVFLAKVSIQSALYLANYPVALGIARLVLGTPIFVLLVAISLWVIRRVTREQQPAIT